MPVEAQRRTWKGGEDLLVAGTVDDRFVTAFDLQGRPVALSADSAPTMPTLVLVPVETNFAAADTTSPTQRLSGGPRTVMMDPCSDPTAIQGCDGGGGPVPPPAVQPNLPS